MGSASYHLPSPSRSVSWVRSESSFSGVLCLLWGADLWLQPPWWMSTVQDPRKTWLAAGTGEVIKMYGPPGTTLAHQAPGHLSCLDLGKAQNTCPTKSVPLQSTQGPEPEQLRSGKCTKRRAHFGQCPCRATWSLSSVDPGSTCRHELGQTQCGPYTASNPHTCQ